MTDGQLKPLTSLRFFAALWVVLYHYWPSLGGAASPAFVGRGYLGVELFFVLSGFILCHVYLQAAGERRLDYGSFLWARIARIYPLHLFVLVGVGLLTAAATLAGHAVDENVTSWAALPANLTLTQAWGLAPVSGWNHPSWSISAEWFAYLAFPAFAAVAWRLRRRPMLAAAASVASIFGLYAGFERLVGFPLTEATIAWGALRIVPTFAFGCAVNLAWRAGAVDRRSLALAASVISTLAIVVLAAREAQDAMIVSMFGLLILGLAGLSKGGASLLSNRTFVWLGEISFAVYMICIPWKLVFTNGAAAVLHLDGKALPVELWLILLAALVPLAAACHHLVERPARTGLKSLRILHRREPTDLKLA